MEAMVKAYFEKFYVRVEVLREYHKRKSYSDVIREGQEALELCIKGILRSIGVEPSFSHDPGKELSEVLHKTPKSIQNIGEELTLWSKKLRKEREFAFYGASDFIPTEEYTKEDSLEVIEFLEKVSKICEKTYPRK